MAEFVSDLIMNKMLGNFIKVLTWAFESPTNCITTVLVITILAVVIKAITL